MQSEFRKYESFAGRWTSPDPLVGNLGDPQSFNRYSYVQNDPANFVDPTGLRWQIAQTCSVIDGDRSCSIVGAYWIPDREFDPYGDYYGGRDRPRGGGGGPQNPTQTPTPQPPCSEQDFNFNEGSGNYSAGDLSAIAQTAVGEASNAFYPNEVEAVIGTIVNRQNLNVAAYPQRGILLADKQ